MKAHVLTALLAFFLLPFSAAAEWWEALGDSTLNRLEARAIEANHDIDVALRRIAIARGQLTSARAAYYPAIDLSAGWEKERHTPSAWTLGADMNWEIDLFGRVGGNVRKQKAQIRASRADAEGTRLSVTASVAQAYVELRRARFSIAIARSLAADQQGVLTMVQARYDAGLADRLDVAQAATGFYSTCASIPPLQASADQALSALAVLLALPADSILPLLLQADGPMPVIDSVLLPESVPAEAIRSRPDVIAAEAQIDVAAASLGIARKEYLPALSLTGSIATSAHSLNDLFTGGSLTYSVAPVISWTLFDGFSRRAAVAQSREQLQIAVEQYNQAVQSGYQEVRNALSAYANGHEAMNYLALTVDQSSLALEKAIALYKLDLTNFTSVMQSQMTHLQYRMKLIEQRADILNAFINFHKALGQ